MAQNPPQQSPTPVRAGLAQRLTTTAQNFGLKPAPTIPDSQLPILMRNPKYSFASLRGGKMNAEICC
ncbi:hypothetical protein [Scytonema millei]|uniref:Uncharacterized protein n=1 Tax=Scytonema millei VB511283 TaxID=1245923 RepID=A0A9X5I2G8_9CYAN|nr:hypothetical protein [Scytonema millei]NHC33583.1 hypothetical protein [Scytonema millei VB511283]